MYYTFLGEEIDIQPGDELILRDTRTRRLIPNCAGTASATKLQGTTVAARYHLAGFKIRIHSWMHRQGAQEDPERRPGGPGDFKTARGGAP